MEKMPDEIQYHILSVIYSLMKGYSLTLDDVARHTCYLDSFNPSDFATSYTDFVKSCQKNEESTSEYSSDSDSMKTLISSEHECLSECDSCVSSTNSPIYVSTRREFCNILSKNIKICPRYSSCTNDDCPNFHVKPEYLCPHNPRGSYCDHEDCDLIVIKPCRRGKRCNDSECSFRH